MGLDPDDDGFDAGANCGCFMGAPWGPPTPEFVWASVTGVARCGGYLDDLPNGTFKLTQDPMNNCRWMSEGGYFNVYWLISPTSGFAISRNLGMAPMLFRSLHMGACLDSFDNQCGCAVPPFFCSAFGGHCDITWGPDKPCGDP